MADSPRKLRSSDWFGGAGKNAFMHRSWMKNQGLPAHLFDGRPVIGICNTASELTPCNAHLDGIAEHVKRGVYEAGGFPLEFPVMSLGESNLRPTAMLFRNLASMDVEESIRGNPIDGVILLVGCDKTTPALLMGAASCDLPTIAVSGGPMLNGNFRGEAIGSGTHVWRVFEELKAGKLTVEDIMAAEQGQSRSAGSCMTMGTASTMEAIVEAVPMVMQCPWERCMQLSASWNSSCVIWPARSSSERDHVFVPDPTRWPRYQPDSIGPPETPMVGRSHEEAPMSSDGVVLSQPISSTTPSMGLPRIDSSTSMEARLR